MLTYVYKYLCVCVCVHKVQLCVVKTLPLTLSLLQVVKLR